MFKLFCEFVVIVTIIKTYNALNAELDDQSTIPLNSNSLPSTHNCMTDDELLVIRDVILKATVQDIKLNKIEFTWDTLMELNLVDKQFIDQIIENTMKPYRYDSYQFSALQFINKTTNRAWKLDGYHTILNIMSSNESLSKMAEHWLWLHYFVIDGYLTNDPRFETLLNEVETHLNQILVPPDFGGLISKERLRFSYCPSYTADYQNKGYLIKRLCSLDSSYIEKNFEIFCSTGYNAKMLVELVTSLEENNRSNYTLLALPYLLRELQRPIEAYNEKQCYMLNQLKNKFSQDSIIRSLLLTNQTFYIKSAYNQEYMYHRIGYEQFERPLISPVKNSTWKFTLPEKDEGIPKIVIRNERFNNGIGTKECEIHNNEWYVTLARSRFEVDNWNLEVDDIFSFQVRIKSERFKKYLRVENNGLILSDFDKDEASKFEWILESASNDNSIHIDSKCQSSIKN